MYTLQTLDHQAEERRALQAAADAEEAAHHRRVLAQRADAEALEQARRRARLEEALAVAE